MNFIFRLIEKIHKKKGNALKLWFINFVFGRNLRSALEKSICKIIEDKDFIVQKKTNHDSPISLESPKRKPSNPSGSQS